LQSRLHFPRHRKVHPDFTTAVVGSASAFKEKTMRSMIVRGAASCALLALSLAAVAQQAKFEIQGNAATESRKNDAIARAITEERPGRVLPHRPLSRQCDPGLR
jgi:hypothetical protein